MINEYKLESHFRKKMENLGNGIISGTIDIQRNGLEYDLIRFTLEPCNFTLNMSQDFVLTYFKQE